MSALQKTTAAGLLVLLVATGYGLWSTQQSAPAIKTRKAIHQAEAPTLVDENTYVLAQRLSRLASTPDEQNLAQSALRLADHELEVAFTAALRENEAHPPALSPEAQSIQERLSRSQKLLDNDQAIVARLTAALAQAHGPEKDSLQDQLDLAQSQLELDHDEVEEANQDLLEAGGNQHQRIQAMMQEHAAATHNSVQAAAPPDPLENLHGLVQRLRQWLTLRQKEGLLADAGARVTSSAAQLAAQRQNLAAQLEAAKESIPELAYHAKRVKPGAGQPTDQASQPGAPQTAANGPAPSGTPPPSGTRAPSATPPAPGTRAPSATPPPLATQAPPPATQPASGIPTSNPRGGLLATTRQIAAGQKLLTLLDQRISDRRQLAAVYTEWSALAASEAQSVLHAALQGAAAVLAILLALLFVDRWLERLLVRTRLDRRQLETLRSIVRVSLQILGVLSILLMLVGMPGQIGTMIGIAGAGLTVALKDFIVAFIGWLVLMGKNGIRLGDWVEINGVGGEVVELNMFHTVLLETGNWTDAGHLTGRRVTFTNSFAIQGHYFNFSTSGQWLWDELVVLVPYDRDPHAIADAVHKEIVQATADSARQAEQEWRHAVRSRRESSFSATPGIIVRPAVGGVEVTVRYVTRASERFALRARLYQSAVQMLAQHTQSLPTSRPRSEAPDLHSV